MMLPRARVGLEEYIGDRTRLVAYYLRRRAVRELDQATFARARDYGKAYSHAWRARPVP